jgi:transposase-like protein
MNLMQLGKLNDEQARAYIEGILWPNGPVCPHCKSDECTRLNGKAHRPGTIQCNDCRGQFTVTVGTVMERSKVSLSRWLMAFHLMCSSKKGFSACQLQRALGLGSYKTAWFMFHRIRCAMDDSAIAKALTGNVEVDETYIGGKPRYRHASNPRGTAHKAPVMVLVERDGMARVKPVEFVDTKTLHAEVINAVAKSATVFTDEMASYRNLGPHFAGGHHFVTHRQRNYAHVNADGLKVTTNTAESFFSLLKRGFIGVYHKMSRKHLHRYCAEYGFRWNHRKIDDSARTDAALMQIQGKRLLYETSM